MPQTTEVKFTDKFGDERVIRRGPAGPWKLKKNETTPVLTISQEISGLIGQRVKKMREKRGYTLAELATRAGLVSGTPKERMWEIENATRGRGVLLATLYALAVALECDICDLLPTVAEATTVVHPVTVTTLAVAR